MKPSIIGLFCSIALAMSGCETLNGPQALANAEAQRDECKVVALTSATQIMRGQNPRDVDRLVTHDRGADHRVPGPGQQLADHRPARIVLRCPRVRHREHEAPHRHRRAGLVFVGGRPASLTHRFRAAASLPRSSLLGEASEGTGPPPAG